MSGSIDECEHAPPDLIESLLSKSFTPKEFNATLVGFCDGLSQEQLFTALNSLENEDISSEQNDSTPENKDKDTAATVTINSDGGLPGSVDGPIMNAHGSVGINPLNGQPSSFSEDPTDV